MKLYEVNGRIAELTEQLEPDPETGEITGDVDAIIAEIDGLRMERTEILGYLAKLVLNARSDLAEIKAEERRLRDRKNALTAKTDRLMAVLDRECGGVKTDCGVATVNYRQTSRVEVTDTGAAVAWLRDHGFNGCYRQPDPEVSKSGVKTLLQDGRDIPGVTLVQERSCSLR